MNRSKHSPETLERLKSNAEAAKRRLSRLNSEYLVRQKAQKISQSKSHPTRDTFADAVSRIAKESQVLL